MTRSILMVAPVLWLATPLAAGEVKQIDGVGRLRPDVDLLMGFEHCAAPPQLYERLQDELLFAAGAQGLAPGVGSLARTGGRGVEGLLVAVRGTAALAIVPATKASSWSPEGGGGDVTRQLRRLDEHQVALGDITLLRDTKSGSAGATSRPLIGGPTANRCAWVAARPAWVRGDSPAAVAAADVHGRSVLRSLDRLRALTLTADFSSEVEVTLRATAADSEDAAVLADALDAFLASRRGNREAPEAVRAAVERGTVQRQSETVTLQLPLSEAALNRIRRNPDSRTLLRLRLEDAERERWQNVAEIVRALDLREGNSVADVGAGEGFFSIRLARAVGPDGRVFAVEIGEKAVAAISRRAESGSLRNVQAVLGAADDPHLTQESLDATLIVNAYHEMPSYEGMLARLFESLKPGGRLVLVEPWSSKRRDEPRAHQVKDHLIAPELAERELRRAGFEIAARRDDFIPGEKRPQWLIQATRPAVVRGSQPSRGYIEPYLRDFPSLAEAQAFSASLRVRHQPRRQRCLLLRSSRAWSVPGAGQSSPWAAREDRRPWRKVCLLLSRHGHNVHERQTHRCPTEVMYAPWQGAAEQRMKLTGLTIRRPGPAAYPACSTDRQA